MTTPFRNDADALKTRLTSLNEEVEALRAQARELEGVRERLAHLEKEQEEVQREVEARSTRATPFLDTLRIASPCHEKWESMTGDERTRHCEKCDKDVHNLSALTRDEAEAFLESVASSICVRMYKRADGTVITADCPVGVRKKRVKRLFLATIGGGLAAAAGALAFWRYEDVARQEADTRGQWVAGGISGPPVMGTTAPTSEPAPTFATPPDAPRPLMGAMAPTPPKKTVKIPGHADPAKDLFATRPK